MIGLKGFCVAVGLAVPGLPAHAATLQVAFDTEWSSLDPHYHAFPYNLSMAHNLFDALTTTDAELRPGPALAESWKAVDANTWEFRLREGVKFADGSPLTPADIIASFKRVPTVPNSPGPITPYVRPIASLEARDGRTLVVHTSEPTPFLPELLSNVYIIPARLAGATTAQFNTGEAAIGSGPYRFVSYARGDRLTLARNEAYWGKRPDWDRAEIRVMTNAASREAALLAHDVDFIINPSPASAATLAGNKAVALYKVASTRITYLQMNQGATVLPDLKGTGGRNPFADARVRRAVSLAIPRQAIAERVLEGLALPAGQMVAPGQFGFDPSIIVDRPDPEAARRLLAEAGWSGGFEVALSTPSDRNLNGTQVAQAIAGALTRIGIRTSVNAAPLEVYIANWRKGIYSLYMHGAGPQPVAALLVPQMAGTKDMKTAFGVSNESGFSDPALDEVMRAAFREIDNAKREALLQQAARGIRDATAIVPLHHEFVLWATRPGLAFQPRPDSLTYLENITPVAP